MEEWVSLYRESGPVVPSGPVHVVRPGREWGSEEGRRRRRTGGHLWGSLFGPGAHVEAWADDGWAQGLSSMGQI